MASSIYSMIIDDEEFCRETLKDLAEESNKVIQVIAEASSVKEGLDKLKVYHPELLFLDVKLGDGTGFDLLKALGKIDFEVIFTTSYDSFAIEAIKFSALDYLLKPVEKAAFDQALERFGHRLHSFSDKKVRPDGKLHNPLQRLALPTREGLMFIDIADVIRIESEKNYSWFYLRGNKKLLITKTIGDFESLLCDSNFFRVHNTHLINLNMVSRYVRGEGGYVVMVDESSVDVARRKRDEFLERLAKA